MHNTNASSRHACGCFSRRKERGNTFGKSGRIFRMDCLSLSCDNYFLWNTEEYNTHCDTQSLLCLSKIAWSMKLQPHTVWPPQHLHLSSIRREWQHIYAESDNIYQRLEYCSVTKKISLSFSTLFLSRCLSLSLLIDTRSLLCLPEILFYTRLTFEIFKLKLSRFSRCTTV